MVVPVTDRKGHDRRYSLDDSLLRSMGYAPAGAVRRRPQGHHRVVRGQPRVVGAARTARRRPQRPAGLRHDQLAGHRRGRDARPRPDRPARRAGASTSPALTRAASTSPTPRGRGRGRNGQARRRGQLRRLDRGRRRGGARGRGPRRQRARRPAHLAAACADAGAALVQVSTDYVFDGDAAAPYAEDAPAAPRTAYGRTKLAGEQAVRAALPDAATWCGPPGCTARTAPTSSGRCSGWPARARPVSVVDDQRGQPTWTADVAAQIHALIAVGAPPRASTTPPARARRPGSAWPTSFGLRRGSRGGPTRRWSRPTTSAAYQRPAPRPAYSVLGHDAWPAAGIPPIGDWRDALHRAFPAMLAAGVCRRRHRSGCCPTRVRFGVMVSAWISGPAFPESSSAVWRPRVAAAVPRHAGRSDRW